MAGAEEEKMSSVISDKRNKTKCKYSKFRKKCLTILY